MSDDAKGKDVTETLADEAKGLAVEVYRDVLKPAMKPVGDVVGGTFKFVLWPVKLALDATNGALETLEARVKEKLKSVPPERQLVAPATIAGPAALQYALLGDSDDVADLRHMFENLLAQSMDAETASNAHPAFVSMISQMTPAEARILMSLTQGEYAAIDVREYRQHESITHGMRTLLGRDLGIEPARLSQCFSNLDRLGIIRIDYTRPTTADHHSYKQLEELVAPEFPGENVSMHAGGIFVTALGEQFLSTCVWNDERRVRASRYG